MSSALCDAITNAQQVHERLVALNRAIGTLLVRSMGRLTDDERETALTICAHLDALGEVTDALRAHLSEASAAAAARR